MESSLKCYSLRLKPGEELKSSLLEFVKKKNLKAAFIVTCCGSVTKATLRTAAGKDYKERIVTFDESFEILSLVGTLSGEGGHLHISLGDKDGNVRGGHVMGDLPVYTTAEVVIGECQDVTYSREMDEQTGYDELVIKPRVI